MFLGLRKLFFTSGGYTPQVPSQGGFYDYAMLLTPVAYWRLGEAGGSLTETLEHDFKLDETTGSTVAVDSENADNGTYNNTYLFEQTALDGGAGTSVYQEPDGYSTEPYIDITTAMGNFSKGDNVQIELYFKTNNTPSTSYQNVLFGATYDGTYVNYPAKVNMDADGAIRVTTIGEPWDDVLETNEVYGSGYDDNTAHSLKVIFYGDGTREVHIDGSLVSPDVAGNALVVDWTSVDTVFIGALYVEEF